MKIIWKILCIICAMGFIGQLIAGKFFFMGLILSILFGYLGWNETKSVNKENQASDSTKNENQLE